MCMIFQQVQYPMNEYENQRIQYTINNAIDELEKG